MRNRAVGAVLESVRTLLEVGTSVGLSDGQLLERYLLRGDDAAEAAFRALVDRHGPMVLRACRGVLHDTHAAEDAFQATFLILARKAGSIRQRDSVASWLFGVARRVAGRAEAQRKRRASYEGQGAAMGEANALSSNRPAEPMPEVQEEVDRLPERYRAPVVLCYLEGLTQEEAASRLRLPASTVRVRLMRARSRLRERLIRRGLAPAGLAGLSASRAEAAMPAPLLSQTIKAAIRIAAGRAAGVSAPVASLVQGAIRAMFFAKVNTAAVLLAALMLASVLMITSLAGQAQREHQPGVAKDSPAAPAAAEKPQPTADGPEVIVTTAKRSRWQRTTNQPGTVVPYGSVDVYARISGYLKHVIVDIGDRVKHGDVLAEIDDPEGAIAVEKARAEVQRAKARFRKAQAALDVSQAAMGVEDARILAAAAALDESETRVQPQKRELDRAREMAKKSIVGQETADAAADRYATALAGSKTARAQLEIARAAQVEARAKRDAAKADVIEAESESSIAQAGLHGAQTNAGYARILSPFDGIVNRRNYHEGALVRSTGVGNVEPIVTVVRTDIMRVIVSVPERNVPYLDEGDPVTVRIDSLGARGVFQGQITRTAYALDLTDRTLRTEIVLPNIDGRLRPGLSGSVAIELETRENVLTIPSTAIVERNRLGKAFCYRVAEGRAIRGPILVGPDNGLRVEVLHGLKEGEIVIANPDARTRDGQAVTIRGDRHDPAAR